MTTASQIAGRTIKSVNPATGAVLRQIDCASDADVRAAVERARRAQPEWNALGVERRIEILQRFQRVLFDRKTEIARAITEEAGKPYVEALLTEVLIVLDSVRFLVENAFGFLRDEVVPHGNPAMKAKRGRILREPHGVIGIHLAMELSVFDPGRRNTRRVNYGECSGVKAVRIDSADGPGTSEVAA
jgi:acyl-CoA reductase-like NAD-dependent aldehyde dehydrogenase